MTKIPKSVAIIGAGHAGGRTALQLRKLGYEGRIRLIGAEQDPPYERPPLSKEALAGEADPMVGQLTENEAYDHEAIELVLGQTVAELDPDRRRLTLAGGEHIEADTLVLATGAHARSLPEEICPPGATALLRTAEDCRRLRSSLADAGELVLIGGGFIGLEVAATAAKLGVGVTLLEAEEHLLSRALPPRIAEHLAKLHHAAGVEIRLGAEVERVSVDGDRRQVTLRGGETLGADVVVCGIGAAVNQSLAQEAGLDCDDGVLVDEATRTSHPGILAVGDVTRHYNPRLGRRLRLESWENAEQQAEVAARRVMGEDAVHDSVPWFWTDQHGCNLQIIGYGEAWDEELLRGDPDDGSCVAFYRREGRIVMSCLVNAGRERRPVKTLMEAKADLPADLLTDEDSSLKKLAKNLDQ